MSLKPGGARLKGQRHEREVVKAFETIVAEAKRGIGQTRGGGKEVSDVTDIPFLHIECKHRKTISIWAAMAQAKSDAVASGKIPTVVVKQNHRPNMVVMELHDFLALFEGYLAWAESYTDGKWEPSTEPTDENTVAVKPDIDNIVPLESVYYTGQYSVKGPDNDR